MKVGMHMQWDANISPEEMINEGIRRAYLNPDNPLRASIVSDPAGKRINTKDNTPAVIHTEIVCGDKIEVTIAAKGFGSENKAKLKILNPHDNISAWVLKTIPTLGAGWCPPGIIGIGIGGTADKAVSNAKEALFEEPINIQQLYQRGPTNRIEELRLSLYEEINKLGIGAQGLGGVTTVLDVKIKDSPTHAASLPVAIIPNCAATRYVKFTLDGSGPCQLTPPTLENWPEIDNSFIKQGRRINLDELDKNALLSFKVGESLLISGKLITGRDAAHQRLQKLILSGEGLPKNLDLRNRFIYYVGPVPKTGSEIIGSAGPTTANRMDSFVDLLLDKTGLIGMIGKAERGSEALEAIKKHKALYCIAVGGAAYLISKAIKSAKILAFEELGMEAMYELEVKDMPVVVAVDTEGNSVHTMGPLQWCHKS